MISGGDDSKALLANGVPNLHIYLLGVNVNALILKLHYDGDLKIEIGLISSN